jgi:two-component system, cell cycle response regulator
MWSQISSGKKFNSEIKNRKKDGEIYWANLTITPVLKDNEIINYTAIRQDVTNKKKLELLAIEDTLTNIYNRRYFNKIIEKELRRTKRENINICLLSIDIDDFKKYNDTFGHPKGDDILINVAQTLKKFASRSTDYIFRMGGEEFCILFSGIELEKALEFSNELIKRIENLQIPHVENKVITISAGLVCVNANDILDVEQLYKYSDVALYEAKAMGKNQVVLFKK